MSIVESIFNIILGLVGVVAFLWMMIGILVGGVWAIVHMSGDKKKKFDVKKWIIVTFGGMILLPIVFMLYAIFSVIKSVAGV